MISAVAVPRERVALYRVGWCFAGAWRCIWLLIGRCIAAHLRGPSREQRDRARRTVGAKREDRHGGPGLGPAGSASGGQGASRSGLLTGAPSALRHDGVGHGATPPNEVCLQFQPAGRSVRVITEGWRLFQPSWSTVWIRTLVWRQFQPSSVRCGIHPRAAPRPRWRRRPRRLRCPASPCLQPGG